MKCTIYMKSGNKIVLRALKTVTVKNTGDEVVCLTWRSRWYTRFFNSVMINSLSLSQIEAVTVKRLFGYW